MSEFNQLVEAIKDNPTIEESFSIIGEDFLKEEITITPYYEHDYVSLQFHGWEIVLLEDGTYFINDTSGG